MDQTRGWWDNLGEHRDDKMDEIDAAGRALSTLSEEATAIRRLITSLEMCHHKAKRRVANLLHAVGSGRTDKGPRLPKGEPLRREQVRWRALADVLDLWVTGVPLEDALDELPHHAALLRDFYKRLGDLTHLKAWQIERLRIRILDHVFPFVHYEAIEADGQTSDLVRQTRGQRLITGTRPGAQTEFSLAAAIDNTVPCNWNFEANLRLVLSTIGGQGDTSDIWAAHACNLQFNPVREEMKPLVEALDDYAADARRFGPDHPLIAPLGEPAPLKKWLAASLAKTIRVQLVLDEPGTRGGQ